MESYGGSEERKGGELRVEERGGESWRGEKGSLIGKGHEEGKDEENNW